MKPLSFRQHSVMAILGYRRNYTINHLNDFERILSNIIIFPIYAFSFFLYFLMGII